MRPAPFPTKGAWDRLFPEPLASMMDPTSRIPLHRVGEHGELANLAAFLLSDYSGYITGESITIDGGEVLLGGEFSHLESVTDRTVGYDREKHQEGQSEGVPNKA